MRTGAAVIVQRGNFVIANGCPLENLIRCGFADKLLAHEPENFARNRLEMQSSYRNVVDRNDRDVIYGFRCVLAPKSDRDAKDE
jgi:hypothetical protein